MPIRQHETTKTMKDFIFDKKNKFVYFCFPRISASTRMEQMMIDTDSNTIPSTAIYT